MTFEHIVSQQRHDLLTDSTLHVVAVISNPARYNSRYRLARKFIAEMRATPNVQLHVVELAFGDRHHEVTAGDGQLSELQLRSDAELWHKENLINIGVRDLLPRDWKYVAWVDADVAFSNPHWALETIHQLQHYPVVQPWTQCLDLGPGGNVLRVHDAYCSLVERGVRRQRHSGEPYKYGHSGYAWACTRAFWENVHGLMDFPILGSADHHMAWAMTGEVRYSVHEGMTAAFKRRCNEWQELAFRETCGRLASVEGHLTHAFHGSKRQRYYRERWQILVDGQFDPDKDLRRDASGVLYLVGKPRLAEEIRRYFRSRHEDSTEVD